MGDFLRLVVTLKKKKLQASNEWLFENRQVHNDVANVNDFFFFFEVGPNPDFSSKVAQFGSVTRACMQENKCRKSDIVGSDSGLPHMWK